MDTVSNLSKLEFEVLQALLDNEDSRISFLKEQVKGISVIKRSISDAGLLLEFRVSNDCAPSIRVLDLIISGVEVTVPNLEFGIGFALFVENGLLKAMEGFTYEEAWPKSISKFRIRKEGYKIEQRTRRN
ncbi:MAG: hypothetical protein OXT65_08570 [Alphaproteobacteria bacterium]|nr:hypothetical protein [Alphaproteobacteria bacterium]